MDTLATPPAIASLVARNVVPIVGAILLDWSAPDLLVLYFVDTLLALGSVLLLVAAHVTGLGRASDKAGVIHARRSPGDWLRGGGGVLLAALLIGLPLGVPLVILLAQFGWSPIAALADRSFAIGLLMQVVASVGGFVQAHRALLRRNDDRTILKHRGAFVFARWFVVMIVAMSELPAMAGPRIGGLLVLVAYAGATVYFELFPERALAWVNPGAKAATAKAGPRAGLDPPVTQPRDRPHAPADDAGNQPPKTPDSTR